MTSLRAVLPPAVSIPWLIAATGTWLVASIFGPAPVAGMPAGAHRGPVVMIRDIVDGDYGPWSLGRIGDHVVLLDFGDRPNAWRGDIISLSGMLDGAAGEAAGRRYASVLEVYAVESVEPSTFLPHRAGRLMTRRVEEELHPLEAGRALLAGFLIGDTSGLDEADLHAMRRTGLAHYVAVSGSNVALFLGLIAVVSGPLGWGPRRRALLGLAALPVYVAATRFEPSVLRASVMAGLALGGRLFGVVLEAWQLLSLAVVVLLLTDAGLVSSLGFQLSVAATAGVLVGARWPARGKAHRALLVTVGAQLAVAPLLLANFATIPLLSPLLNLIAGPLVAISTLVGALGVALFPPFVEVATWLAGVVLTLAHGSAGWPQLEAWQLVGVVAGLTVTIHFRLLRPALAVCAAGRLVVLLLVPGHRLPTGAVAVLDVGQGDAILLHGGDGHYALVDGGPEQSLLLDRLHSYGVFALDLVVLSHTHADHAVGLTGLMGRVEIGRVWEATAPHSTEASRRLLSELARFDIPVESPPVGASFRLGALDLRVEGPLRRYASPNDQSLVITVRGSARTMLLSGDIETHAQEDLDHLRADVLKVPHQGAGTSDPSWLREVGAELAVISVGPNDYGHPTPWVVDLLEERGELRRTDVHGDVIVDLKAS